MTRAEYLLEMIGEDRKSQVAKFKSARMGAAKSSIEADHYQKAAARLRGRGGHYGRNPEERGLIARSR